MSRLPSQDRFAGFCAQRLSGWASATNAAGSIANIGNVPLDHPCIDYCLIAKDNDPGPQANADLDRAVEALERFGKRIEIMAPHETDDFNSLLQT